MTTFSVIDAKEYHCGQMIRRLRGDHKQVLKQAGINAHLELRSRFAASAFRRAWFIDGKLAALGGVVGSHIGTVGYVWLALSDLALNYPIATAREARRQLDEIMQTRRELATIVLPRDFAAVRFAVFLGFHVADQGLGSQASDKPQRLALRRFLETATELRIPMGKVEGIPMGYHSEAI